MTRFLSLALLAGLALVCLGQVEGIAVGCVDNMGADGPSIGNFNGKGRELSQCVRDYRQKYGREFECGLGLRGKTCVQIKDHFQSFLDDLSLCLAGPTTAAPATTTSLPNPKDCKDLADRGETGDRVTTIFPDGQTAVSVRCVNSCTVMINRDSLSPGFDKSYAEYAQGFGDRSGDYYIGNNVLDTLTSEYDYTLKVDIVRPDNTPQSAQYSTFQVGPPTTNYTLTVGGYSGNAGDALSVSNGLKFSTYDSDNVATNGAIGTAIAYGGGFWYTGDNAGVKATVTASAGDQFTNLFTWGDTPMMEISAARLCLDRA